MNDEVFDEKNGLLAVASLLNVHNALLIELIRRVNELKEQIRDDGK